MLCKTAVARKAIAHAWANGIALRRAEISGIDAEESFGAAVDACLLVCDLSSAGSSQEVRVYPSLQADKESAVLGYRNGRMVADVLSQLDLIRLAEELGTEPHLAERLLRWSSAAGASTGSRANQRELFPTNRLPGE
ncbi:MAG: hypothetical protein GXY83_06945 [Rhodopirellula sp.]|nr:hypothetical protein [Rhodopirellula sp.]